MIFQEIGGQFIAVDSAENSPPTLDYNKTKKYKSYGGRIGLNITQDENK